MSWKPEVIADCSGAFVGNAVRFDTEDEAQAYVVDLARRWVSVVAIRVREVDDAVTHRWVDGRLTDYEPPDSPGWEGGFAANH
jgi:hypothetical protein